MIDSAASTAYKPQNLLPAFLISLLLFFWLFRTGRILKSLKCVGVSFPSSCVTAFISKLSGRCFRNQFRRKWETPSCLTVSEVVNKSFKTIWMFWETCVLPLEGCHCDPTAVFLMHFNLCPLPCYFIWILLEFTEGGLLFGNVLALRQGSPARCLLAPCSPQEPHESPAGLF